MFHAHPTSNSRTPLGEPLLRRLACPFRVPAPNGFTMRLGEVAIHLSDVSHSLAGIPNASQNFKFKVSRGWGDCACLALFFCWTFKLPNSWVKRPSFENPKKQHHFERMAQPLCGWPKSALGDGRKSMNTDINHLPPILSFHGEGIPKCGRRWRMMSLSRCKCPVSLRGRSTSSHSAAEGKYGPSVMRSFVQQDQPPVAWWFGLIVWRLQVRSPLVH